MLKILHLYPNLMNLYGDYANVDVLVKHLNDQGIKTRVDKKEINDKFDLNNYDFIYMGSGSESKQLIALKDLLKYAKELKQYIKDNKVLLFTGNAMELLGKSIGKHKALNILDFNVEVLEKRYTGDAIVFNDEFKEVVGFINKSSLIKGGKEYKLFDYIFKDNNLLDNNYEGYRINNCFGTHIIGPILMKNPKMLEYIVKLLLGKKEYKDIEYIYEIKSHDVTYNALRSR